MADHAACSADTTHPLLAKNDGGAASAASSRCAQSSCRAGSRWRSPMRASSSPVSTAWRMAAHQMMQASPASGSQWVSWLIAVAACTIASSSSMWARATGAVRISEPLPPLRPVRACSACDWVRARSAVIAPSRVAARRTEEVWSPMSLVFLDHCSQRVTIASCADSSRRSAPVAATSAMAIAIAVSSVHSPTSQPRPPTIATSLSSPRGGPNS